ncbi:modin [Colletotrichum karsti]|uniref:Modin n=1 Tax=Colletotrichum karsti TaxID=1095194 RepID=A0A9P6LHC2_9PEZI|nr:modin [Colletotrichum karsti]KAF9873418.1 modin [Colletotrichum karsti]
MRINERIDRWTDEDPDEDTNERLSEERVSPESRREIDEIMQLAKDTEDLYDKVKSAWAKKAIDLKYPQLNKLYDAIEKADKILDVPDQNPDETASDTTWIWLLAAVQRMEKESKEWDEKKREQDVGRLYTKIEWKPSLAVKIQAMRRSFDANPAIKKPYATTTISHLVELASVLGLYWKVFDREDNKYRAEGNGYSLTGSRIADFGIVFVFEKVGHPSFEKGRIIPAYEVKELCFGRVPTLFREELPKNDVEWLKPLKTSSSTRLKILQLGSREEIMESLTSIGCNVNTTLYFKEPGHDKHLFPVTFEIMGMLARVLHIKDTCFRYLPNPTVSPWNKESFSLRRLLIAFNARLQRHVTTIEESILEQEDQEGDIPPEATIEKRKMRDLAGKAASLDGVPADETELSYSRMNAFREAIKWCDGILTEEDLRKGVLDVLRRHLHMVLATINSSAPADKGDKQHASSEQTISFERLLKTPLEKREDKFMDIYFDSIVWEVISSDEHHGEEQQVSRAIHEDMENTQRTRAEHRNAANERSLPVSSQNEESPQTPDGQEISFPGLTHRKTWPPREETKLAEARGKETPNWKERVRSPSDMKRLTIWYTMVFRMVCWLTLHDFDKRDVQLPPSELIGSRQPVFIM